MDNKNKETFSYTYSAKEQEEIKTIRKKYVEEEQTEDPGTELGEEGKHTHFKGSGTGTGDAQGGTDDGHGNGGDHQSDLFAKSLEDGVDGTVETDHCEDSQNSQTGVCQDEAEEAEEPLVTGAVAEERGEDHVACAEEGCKHCEAENQGIAQLGFLMFSHGTYLLIILTTSYHSGGKFTTKSAKICIICEFWRK